MGEAVADGRNASALAPPFRRLLLGGFTRHPGAYLAGSLFTVATNVLALAVPWCLKLAIEALQHADRRGLLRAVGGMVGASLATGLTDVLSRGVLYGTGRTVEYELRRRVFRHLLKLPPSFHRAQTRGDLMSRVTNDLGQARMLYGAGFLEVVNTVSVYASTVGAMAALDPRLTLWALAPVPLLLVVVQRAGRRIYRVSQRVQEALSDVSSFVQEHVSGIEVVKGYRLEGRREERFRRLNDRYVAVQMDLVRVRGILGPLLAAVGGVGTALVIGAGGSEVVAGRVSLGTFAAFTAYLGLLLWPTFGLGWVWNVIQRGLASLDRLGDLVEAVPSIRDLPGAESLARGPDGGVRLEGGVAVAGLTVPAAREAAGGAAVPRLDAVRIEIPPGSSLGVVGPTGSGKTTLLESLLRLLEIPEGTVYLDGRDLTRVKLADFRRRMGFVAGDPTIFSRSVADNIALGLDPPEPGRIVDAALRARIDEEVREFPRGYEALVGERGVLLSGGQRQRLAIARALAVRPRVLLLDDALSSVDAETEAGILAEIRAMAGRLTIVVVAHRPSTVAWTDRVAVLEGGRLVEWGPPAELAASGGLFARMVARERIERELARL